MADRMDEEERITEKLCASMGYPVGSRIGMNHARRTLAALQGRGLNIYKKKVFRQRRRPTSSAHMTPELREAILNYFHDHPNETQQEIAVRFSVNSGRVNEIVNGTDR